MDCGLSAPRRELLSPHVTLVAAPEGREPFTLKAVLPLARPAETMVLIDTDVIVTRPLGPLISDAAEGRVVAFKNHADRFVDEWAELLDLAPLGAPLPVLGPRRARRSRARPSSSWSRTASPGSTTGVLLRRPRSRLPAALCRPGRAERSARQPLGRRAGGRARPPPGADDPVRGRRAGRRTAAPLRLCGRHRAVPAPPLPVAEAVAAPVARGPLHAAAAPGALGPGRRDRATGRRGSPPAAHRGARPGRGPGRGPGTASPARPRRAGR